MNIAVINCPRCHAVFACFLHLQHIGESEVFACPACTRGVIATVNPRGQLDVAPGTLNPEQVDEVLRQKASGTESPYYHPTQEEASPCSCFGCSKTAPRVEGRPMTVPELMEDAKSTYIARNTLYGDSYKKFGAVLHAMFPDGPPPMHSAADWSRFMVFMMALGKLHRYAANMPSGGHVDSARDAAVYSFMLEEITEECPF